MSTAISVGWLNDKNGDKFAPKTLISQIVTTDGVNLENKFNNYMTADNPTGTGNLSIEGNATFTGDVKVNSISFVGGGKMMYDADSEAIRITFDL